MLYAFGRKSSFFHDTIRAQYAVFESGQERLAEVGHGVVWCAVGGWSCAYVLLLSSLMLSMSSSPDRIVYVHSVRPVFISRHTAYSEHVATGLTSTFYIVIPSSSSRL